MVERVSALGLDVGQRRVGVAGCDGTGLIASELTTIRRTSFTRDVEQLQQLIDARGVRLLVVGMPYTLDGNSGVQARAVSDYAERLGAALQVPVEFVDERLTSVEAEAQLRSNRRFSPRRDKAAIDARAAAIILQQWLDRRRSGS
ncbi:RNAse H-fold protein YqgF [Rubidibacter lacunae KORDI 51-2]|uniref:Putative pre-16S rRNA nuclease n=1 Tax=Rubidibacter lacunae KORDI 51-2 TaxID=582515 RepID=U5DNE6_9CHRO|nr:Holliday junction resolvase RuvX [Rubidibacter lacunae]ERN41225.1 RNAse H-fold protein YqgF [Rubidibacter lacunae KORDI 51-2]